MSRLYLKIQKKDSKEDFSVEFPSGVSETQIINAESELGFLIPSELKSLLMEFDGVYQYDYPDGEKLQIGSWIWDLSSIVEWHLTWTIPQQRKLLCFGGSISGNDFGYLLSDGKPVLSEIWQSDHETEWPEEDILKRASGLEDFILNALLKSHYF